MRGWKDPCFSRQVSIQSEADAAQTPDDESEVVTLTTVCKDPFLDTIVARFSNLEKLKRVVNNCLIFSAKCRKRFDSSHTVELQDRAEKILIRHCQQNAFWDDIKQLESTGQVATSSKLASLNPHIDDDKILRARGRLQNADIPTNMKDPVILPSNDHLTHLIIEDLHKKIGHVGLKHVISKIRERFWVLRCVSEVKKIWEDLCFVAGTIAR